MMTWLWYAAGSAVFAGLTSILAKIGIKRTDSNVVTALRTAVVLVFAWIMVFLSGSQEGIRAISAEAYFFLVLSGLATGASWLCYFKALQLGEVSRVAPIDKSSTILTMLLAFVLLREPVSAIKVLCMALIFTGTMLMVSRTEKERKQQKNRWLIFAVLSAVFASLTSILAKVGMSDVESNLGTAIRTCVVLVMAWVVVFKTKKQGEIRNVTGKDGLFICLSGLATGASWLCYYHALQTGPASIVVPIDKLSIVVTVLFSRLFLGEKLSFRAFTGLLLIVCGTLLLLV